jgi:hypothetical protein
MSSADCVNDNAIISMGYSNPKSTKSVMSFSVRTVVKNRPGGSKKY